MSRLLSNQLIGELLRNAGIPYAPEYMTPPDDVNKVKGHLIPEPVLLGVEFEWEGTGSNYATVLKKYPDMRKHWLPTLDRSLRGDDAIEFKTLGPMSPPNIEDAILSMMDASAKWKASRRTGLHVHMNTGHMSYRQFSNFTALYVLFEPCIFQAAGDERSANPFTVPLWKDGWVTGSIAYAMQGPDSLINNLQNRINKYCGLNLASLFTYGTAEFRHLRTTHSLTKIFNWINMILYFHRFARRDDFEKLFCNYLDKRDYRGLLAQVYEGNPWAALVYEDMEEEIEALTLDLAYEFYFSRESPSKSKKKPKGKKVPLLRDQIPQPVRILDDVVRFDPPPALGQDEQIRAWGELDRVFAFNNQVNNRR